MGRRILAFFLGMIFGVIVFLGAIAGAAYFAATKLTPDDIYPDSNKFFGDLADMTLMEIYNEISALYKEKLGVEDENGLYYTLGEFMEKYHIDPETAFGKPLSQDILEIPIFEFLGGSTEGAMKQIKASVPFSLVNFMTQSTDDDGNVTGGYFSQSVIDKLYKHPITELADSELGAKYVFEEVLFCDLMPSSFPAEMPESGDRLMWALGQASVGRLLGGLGGNVMLQFKEGGAFETMGSLTMKELLGKSSEYIEIIFGEEIFASLIDDDGTLLIDTVMENLYMGKLLSYDRKAIDADLVDEYTPLPIETEDGTVILFKTVDDVTTYAITEGENTYEARIVCNNEEHEHVADCFQFVWYDLSVEKSDHEHSNDCYNSDTEASGMFGKLASKRLKELNDMGDILKTFTFKDVLGNNVPPFLKTVENTPVGDIEKTINNMYMGDFLLYVKKPVNVEIGFEPVDGEIDGVVTDGNVIAKRNDDGTWYDATLNCTEEHTHDYECYDYNWYNLICVDEENHLLETDHVDDCYVYEESLIGRISRLKMSELKGDHIKKVVNETPLGEIIDISNANGLLKELADVTVGELSHELDALYVGIAMGYHRNAVDYTGSSDPIAQDTKSNNEIYKDGANLYFYDARHNVYYEAQLMCLESDHQYESDHTFHCYGFVWYNCNHETDETHQQESVVKGLNGKMSNLRLDELGSEVGMTKIAKSLTITDLIESDMVEFTAQNITTLNYIFDGEGWRELPLKTFLSTLLDNVSRG